MAEAQLQTSMMATLHHRRIVPFLLATASWAIEGVASFSVAAPPPPPAEPSKALFPFQEDGAARLVADKRLLLADDMGLGKTVQSIAALNHLFANGDVSPDDCRVLIICPKSVVAVWVDELERWLNDRYFSIEDGLHIISAGKTEPLDEQSSRGTIQIINYDICHKYRATLQSMAYDVMIADEAHYLKSARTKRSDAILGIKDGNGIQANCIWLLTGTPILNRPSEIYPLLWALDERQWSSYYAFEKTWGGSFNEVSNLGELKRLMQPRMLRRKKVDVLRDLPPKLYSIVSLEGSEEATEKEQSFAFDAFGIDLSAAERRKGSSKDSEESLGAFGEGATLRKYGIDRLGTDAIKALASIRSYTASLKVEPAVQLLKEYTRCEKVVVFAHHRRVILDLANEFGDKCVHIIGGMDSETRADAVDRFQNDPSCRLFIGSIRAAGVGLTLTAASHVIFMELDWSPGIMTQAEDRCHRVGQQDSVQVDYFVFKGTVDAWMAKQLARKSQGIRRTLAQGSKSKGSYRNNYRMDFGKFRGMPIDEIPFDYLNNFLLKEDVYRKRPALWNALYLSDIVDEAPLNLELEEENEGDEEEVDGAAYTFDFGKFYGMEWSQVPQNYRDWVIEAGVWKKRKGLWIALHEGGLVEEEPELSDEDDSEEKPEEQPEQMKKESIAVEYTFDFGKYNGRQWRDADEGYREWIVKTKDVWRKRRDLWAALYKAGLVEEKPNSE